MTDIIVKKAIGRPRKETVVTSDTDNRKSIVNVDYMKTRYATDEKFREACKQRSKMYYQKAKQAKQKKLSLNEHA